jgi:hypothetical protein
VLLSRNPDIYAAELDGEACLFNPKNAEYLNLNSTASCIWSLLENQVTFEDLVCTLQRLYMVDQNTCRLETERFVEEALQKGILQASQ